MTPMVAMLVLMQTPERDYRMFDMLDLMRRTQEREEQKERIAERQLAKQRAAQLTDRVTRLARAIAAYRAIPAGTTDVAVEREFWQAVESVRSLRPSRKEER